MSDVKTDEKRSRMRCIAGAVAGAIGVPLAFIVASVGSIALINLVPRAVQAVITIVLCALVIITLGAVGAFIAYEKCRERE